MRRICLSLLATMCILLPAQGARAEPSAEYYQKVARGEMNAKRYKPAITALERAAALSTDPRIRCNLGVAHHKNGSWLLAHIFLDECLATVATLHKRDVAKMRMVLAATAKALAAANYGKLRIIVQPANAQVFPLFPGTTTALRGSRTLWAPVGKQTLEARAPNHEPKVMTAVVTKGKTVDIVIKLTRRPQSPPKGEHAPPPTKPAEAPPTSAPSPQPAPTPTLTPPAITRAAPTPRRRTAMWIAFGVAAAGLAAAIPLHLRALDKVDEVRSQPTPETHEMKAEELRRQQPWVYGAYAVAGLATGLGSYLWWKHRGEQRGAHVSASVAPGGGMVWAAWDL